ncbi:MAG: ABC transporter substrate-binding protein [Fretibacterium sp.]|nr:ABC transporter substrate-binding protein [Fretibacterium sp.]
MRKILLAMVLAVLFVTPACAAEEEIPTIRTGFIRTTHQQGFTLTLQKGEEFKDFGVYFKPVVDKEKYDLYRGEERLARFEIVVAKSGSETAALFAQGHLDLAHASFPAILSAIDSSTPVKVLAPIQADGISLVGALESPVNDWDSFMAYVKEAKAPVKLGYHSPTSAPKILIEAALFEAGLRTSGDGNATKKQADILLVDLKSTSNFHTALTSGQVDFWVGPTPAPEVAVLKKQGKLIISLNTLPPAGKWQNFPCCVTAARTDAIEKYPEALKAYMELLTKSSEWCSTHKAEADKLSAVWYGVPEEATQMSQMTFSTDPNEKWMKNAALYPEMLNKMGQFKGQLKDKTLEEAKDLIFDFRFLK